MYDIRNILEALEINISAFKVHDSHFWGGVLVLLELRPK